MNIAEKIMQKAEELRDITASELSEIVKIPSLSGEEKNVVLKLADLCTKAGFDEVKIDGLGNLIGRIGNGKKILAIDAHIDTVDTGDVSQWELEPYSGLVKDGFVNGRGSVDQKGGAASMIAAGKILKALGYDKDYTILFTFTVMEEDCDGLCWKYLIEEENIKPDFAVSTEPTNCNIYRGHRGRMEIEVHFKGVSCHGSAPERGDNAIYKAARAALEIEKLNNNLAFDEFLGKGTITASMIKSESPSLCAVADIAMIHLDRRLTWGENLESACAEVQKAAGSEAKVVVPIYSKKSYKGTLFEQEKYFPTWKLEENHPLVQAGVTSYKSLFNADPQVDKWTFSTNGVAICGRFQIPVIGFGPGNEIFAHAPNEKTPVDQLVQASAFYAMLPYILSDQK